MSSIVSITRKDFLKRIEMTSKEFQGFQEEYFGDYAKRKKKLYFVSEEDDSVYVTFQNFTIEYVEKFTYHISIVDCQYIISLVDYKVVSLDNRKEVEMDFRDEVIYLDCFDTRLLPCDITVRYENKLIKFFVKNNVFSIIEGYTKEIFECIENIFSKLATNELVDTVEKLKKTKINRFKGFEDYSKKWLDDEEVKRCDKILEKLSSKKIGNDWLSDHVDMESFDEKDVFSMYAAVRDNTKSKTIRFAMYGSSEEVVLDQYDKSYSYYDFAINYTVEAIYNQDENNYVVYVYSHENPVMLGFILDTQDTETVVNVVDQNMRSIEKKNSKELLAGMNLLGRKIKEAFSRETAHDAYFEEIIQEYLNTASR